jgi:hypothetical protein
MAKKPSEGATQRQHRATYAKDKKKGGYLIRVEGPSSNMFAGREVPVNTKDGGEHIEMLDALIWSGKDNESGKPVSLYSFVAKPKEPIDTIEF